MIYWFYRHCAFPRSSANMIEFIHYAEVIHSAEFQYILSELAWLRERLQLLSAVSAQQGNAQRSAESSSTLLHNQDAAL